jgi:hypothetical protein
MNLSAAGICFFIKRQYNNINSQLTESSNVFAIFPPAPDM